MIVGLHVKMIGMPYSNTEILCCVVLLCILLCCVVLYCTVLCCAVLNHIVLFRFVLYYTSTMLR